jgi:ribonucleoside-diphosphate reductase beta chain
MILNLDPFSPKLFFGEGRGIARYDVLPHPIFYKLNTKMKSFYWNPEVEVDWSGEKSSFESLSEEEQFVFTSNLKRQILLDSIQGRAPSMAFLPHCTDPSLENCILTWSFFESIHSESYTHIIRAIYSDPSVIFDDLPNIVPIVDCATAVTHAYDALIDNPNKENLYLALISANALEAIRFPTSFACTFSFAERGKVEASAKVVKLISRDETQHMALVQHILKALPKDDPDFVQIIGDNRNRATEIFDQAGQQEIDWVKYLFSQGSILGLNEKILIQYVEYLLPRRKAAIGLSPKGHHKLTHPIPWVEKWYGNINTQVAPQEVELSSYLVGTLTNDTTNFKFSL